MMSAALLLLAYMFTLGLSVPVHDAESAGKDIHDTFPARIHSRDISLRDVSQATLSTTAMTINTGGASGTYPRLVTLTDGSILLGYTSINGNTKAINVLKSTDSGKTFNTWGAPIVSSTSDVDNGKLFFLTWFGSHLARNLSSSPTICQFTI